MGPVETRHFDDDDYSDDYGDYCNDEHEGGDDDDDDDDIDGAKRIYDPGRSNWLELDLLPIAGYCRLMRTEFDPVYFSQFVNRICFNLS